MLSDKCLELNLSEEFIEDARYVLQMIEKDDSLGSCPNKSKIACAMSIINRRYKKMTEMKKHCRSLSDIAKVCETNYTTMIQNTSRLRDRLVFILPEKYLNEAEKLQRFYELEKYSHMQMEQQITLQQSALH